VFPPADHVVRPYLLRQRPTHEASNFLDPCACGARFDTPPMTVGLASHLPRRQYRLMDNSSGVGVLDKAATVLGALEAGPATLAQLVASTHLARPTAHRLAVALEHHRLVSRDMQGRFVLGPRLAELASSAGEDRLLAAAGSVLVALRDHTGESAQLYRRQGDQRICVAAAEKQMGLRDSIPV